MINLDYVWNNPLNWLEMLRHTPLSLAKTETKRRQYWNDNMNIVLTEWGFTIDAAEMKIGNLSMHDVDAEK